ncbi:MAG: SLC13/DASS family transporter [Methanomassiliicoccales archaeon]|nr:SLC13/DASS family transporter [Methanomassiliicoccales archaeon]
MNERGEERSLGTIIYSLRDRLPFFAFFRNLRPSWQRAIKLLVPFLVLAVFILLPLDLERPVQDALGIFLCIAMMWTFESLPLPATALLVPVLLTLFGVFHAAEALEPYADPVVFLMIGGLILAEAFRRNGLDKRMAYIMVLRAGGDRDRTLLYLMAASAFLSMWISNTATVAILIPVVFGITGRLKGLSLGVTVRMLLGIGIGSAAGGMMTITGSAPNAIASGLLAQETTFTFLDWMTVGVPMGLMLLLLSWYLLTRLYPAHGERLDVEDLRLELQGMGGLNEGERRTLTIFLPTVVLWVIGADIASWLGLPPSFMSAAVVALSAAVGLFVVKAIQWDDARSIAWDVFLIIGSGLALGEGLVVSGAAEWMAEGLGEALLGAQLILVLLVLAAVTIAITNFISNTATAAMFIPILLGLSRALDVSPQLLVLTCGLCVSLSFITPIGTPPITLVYSTKMVGRGDLARAGLAITVPAAVVICLFLLFFDTFGLF